MIRRLVHSTALAASLAGLAGGAMAFEVIERPIERPEEIRPPRPIRIPSARPVLPAPAPTPVPAPVPVPPADMGGFSDAPAALPSTGSPDVAVTAAPSEPVAPPPEMLSHQVILEAAMRIYPELHTREMYALWFALSSVQGCQAVTRMHELQIAALERTVPDMLGEPREVIYVHRFPMPVYDDGVFRFGQIPRNLVERVDRVQARPPDTGRGVCSPLRAFRSSIEIATDFTDLPMERRIAHRILDQIGVRRSVVAVFHISPEDFRFTGSPGRNAGLLVDIRPSRVSIHHPPSAPGGHAGDLIATFNSLTMEWTSP